METPTPLSLEQIPPEDWAQTPNTVKRLLESLQAIATLSESERRLIQFLEATPIGIAVHDATGQLIYINVVAQSLLSTSRRSESNTDNLSEVFQVYRSTTQTLYPVTELPSTRALAGETVRVDDLEIHLSDRIVPLEVWAIPIWDEQSRVKYAISTFQDISDRKRVEQRLQNLATNTPGIIYQYILYADGSEAMLYVSPGCYELWELSPQMVVNNLSLVWNLVHVDDLAPIRQSIRASAVTLQPWTGQWRMITPSGCLKWMQASSRPHRQQNGDIIWDGLILDVSTLKQTEAALRESESRYRLLAENMNDLVCLNDIDGRYLYVSPSCETLLGYSYTEMLGKDFYSFLHPDDRERVVQETQATIQSGRPNPITYRMRQRSGQYIWFETLTKPIADAATQFFQLQTTSREVTERVEVQNQLEYDAMHDALTGLPNRNLLLQRLELSIHRAKCNDRYKFAVLFLDLDRFKVVNDSLGHLVGDQLLVAIAQKLQAIVREIDLVVRLGGDEFVILLEDIREVQEVIHTTERILVALQGPMVLVDRTVYTSTSIGVVLSSQDYQTAAHLLRDADIAMYRAKNQGRNCYAIFDTAMHQQALQRLNLEHNLRHALRNQEFVLHYQPIVDLKTGTMIGLEALIRWLHPSQGLIPPGAFIPIAEETGLILEIDYWAIRAACQQLSQ